ncbi:hypothetical protein V475_06535 [Sphingobium baderi LL03]|uniref:Uncharacterized protein n=1 Tax=Sphingobium baderi LL03 TaxID=1114964 RepID=T0GQP8_9SPHN|nr:hypothetical protein L485_01060 [Sphingobium baderi LL03]KMS62714.1 hypothetical protein V475_06535 [Sphingobium baderi LL03]
MDSDLFMSKPDLLSQKRRDQCFHFREVRFHIRAITRIVHALQNVAMMIAVLSSDELQHGDRSRNPK